jgi:glycosyltransferase involved in cell wall biosynthesis
MQFILYSQVGEDSIRDRLGRPEYSYYFVMSGFRRALQDLGRVVMVAQPEAEVDTLYDACVARGEDCVFLSFSPPHKTAIGLRCPTVVVVAWEFDTIPTGGWDDEKRNDWRLVFAKLGRAICLSSYSARAIKAAMGADFPVAVIAVPVPASGTACRLPPADGIEIGINGTIIDSPSWGFRCDLLLPPDRPPAVEAADEDDPHPPELLADAAVPFHPGLTDLLAPAAIDPDPLAPLASAALGALRPPASALLAPSSIDGKPAPRLLDRLGLGRIVGGRPPMAAASPAAASPAAESVDGPAPPVEPPAPPPPAVQAPEQRVRVSGIVYTAVFNPTDGRKNWMDLLTSFVYTFREVEDATLVLKMIHYDPKSYYDRLFVALSQLAPFKCRVISLYGYLETTEYRKLVDVSHYYASAARAEGLCLPLMEFMASGKPAVTPLHTAMEDYVDSDAGFIVASSREYNVWSHDPRALYTTNYYRIDWQSLCDQFRESYRVAKDETARYQAMGAHAAELVQSFGSVETVTEGLRRFFLLPASAAQLRPEAAAS